MPTTLRPRRCPRCGGHLSHDTGLVRAPEERTGPRPLVTDPTTGRLTRAPLPPAVPFVACDRCDFAEETTR
jgi:hypothetical protein